MSGPRTRPRASRPSSPRAKQTIVQATARRRSSDGPSGRSPIRSDRCSRSGSMRSAAEIAGVSTGSARSRPGGATARVERSETTRRVRTCRGTVICSPDG